MSAGTGTTVAPVAKPGSNEQISEYRKGLQSLEQQMQSEYDKAVMALSGGALGVSMAFLKDVVLKPGAQGTGTQCIQGGGWLLAAWICWGLSVTCTLVSFFTSASALRSAIQKTDDRTIYTEWARGRFNTVTKALNFLAGALFMGGVILIVCFVSRNLP